MTTGTSIRAAALAVLAVAAWTVPYGASKAGASDLARCEPQTQTVLGGENFRLRSITLGKGKSLVCDFPRDIKNVLVGDPKTANAVILSLRRAYIIANTAGATDIDFFDAEGRQMARFAIAVAPDVSVISTAIRRLIPGADVNVEAIGDGIMLTGTVSSQTEAQQACDIASHFAAGDSFASGGSTSTSSSNGSSPGGGTAGGTAVMVTASSSNSNGGGGSGGSPSSCRLDKVVNAIIVRGRDQIMLKVTVAEVERDLIKQLGINLSGSLGYGAAVVNFNNNNPFTAYGQSLSGSSIGAGWKSITGTLQAMEQAGVIHTLAEPTLTAISGEKATFFAGGQFPVLNGFSCSAPTSTPGVAGPSTCQPSIQFKNFGVALNFMPVVLSGGRISLNVTTDVSDLSTTNALNIPIPGSTESVTVPSIRERSASTTVEIPSGGALALAGMIQNTTRQNINGLPGLMELPVLGALFKSRDYINQQTELMILVTPYVVRAVAQKDLSRPDDGFADPSDPASVLLGRLNRIYGVGGIPDPPDNYRGKYGFILD
jgi:pilus assembly protein CpaC